MQTDRVTRFSLDLPSVWLVFFLLLAWLLTRYDLLPRFEHSVVVFAGWLIIGVAFVIAVWAALWFWRCQTSIIPGRVAANLITDGPYRYSRNPVYAADVLILIGQGFVLGSFWPFIFAPFFVAILNLRFVIPEETMLIKQFGDAYIDWSLRVRRWI